MEVRSVGASCVLLILFLTAQSPAQDYQPSAVALRPVLTPRAPQPQAPTPPSFTQPNPAPAPAADPAPPTPPQEPRRTLGTGGKEILRKFDDYLFKNLEDAYFRLSYAFEDAAKRALEDCGCHVVTASKPTTPPTK